MEMERRPGGDSVGGGAGRFCRRRIENLVDLISATDCGGTKERRRETEDGGRGTGIDRGPGDWVSNANDASMDRRRQRPATARGKVVDGDPQVRGRYQTALQQVNPPAASAQQQRLSAKSGRTTVWRGTAQLVWRNPGNVADGITDCGSCKMKHGREVASFWCVST